MVKTHEFAIEQGAKVRDGITGFAGMVTARVQYITGCNQYLVQPPVDEGYKWVESRWFDEDRLTLDHTAPDTEYDTAQSVTADTGFGEKSWKRTRIGDEEAPRK